jgi:hypothetical protein
MPKQVVYSALSVMGYMKAPCFVGPLTDDERSAVNGGIRHPVPPVPNLPEFLTEPWYGVCGDHPYEDHTTGT